VNYPIGRPGSFFTITGWNFPPGAAVTLSINSWVAPTNIPVNATGSFLFFLDSSGASPGGYVVMVSANPTAAIGFGLSEDAPLRLQEGGGDVFVVPGGVALDQEGYLPLVVR
jgi:hypothetical protein